ncbi:MAG: tetratricopeptide repeat protein [Cyanobacteria bacterium J06560_2]
MTAALINRRYRILRALGEGGFGKTFLAEDIQMPSRRRCVVKQLKPMGTHGVITGGTSPETFTIIRQRFDREAAVLESISKGHSQIPDLYAYLEEDGKFYLVQEWIDGQPLSALMATPWSEAQVSALLSHTLAALSHIHAQGLIHRDIKPDNIILRQADQLPCLIDFGAVKELMNTSSANEASSIAIGTPGYMPPEQVIGRPTFSSDLYSLGLCAIALLTGQSPIQMPTDSRTGATLWRQFAPSVSEPLAAVLTKASQPTAQNRYSTAVDMLAALPLQGTPSTSILPTVVSSEPTVNPAASPVSSLTTANAPKTQQQGQNVVTHNQSTKALPLKQVGLAAGALLLGIGIFGTVGTVRTQGISAPLKEAIAAKESGDYEAALSQLDTILTQSPSNTIALITKGKIEDSQGNYEDAIATFTQAIADNSNSAEAYERRGDTYGTIGEYDKALDDFRSALRIDSDHALAYEGIALINSTTGNPQEALSNINKAIEKDSNLASAYFLSGSLKTDNNDKAGAIEDWENAIAISPTTAADYFYRGKAKSRLNDKAGAMEDFNQALVLNPNFEPAYTARAFPFLEQGEVEQSLNEISKALAINPNSVQAIFIQTFFLGFDPNADPQDTLDLYARALAVNPNDTGILNGRCTTYTAIGDLEKAIADCTKSIDIDPKMTDSYVNRANIYFKQDKFDLAIQDHTRAIEILREQGNEAEAASAYANRSGVLVNTGDFEGAFSDIDKALDLDPSAPSYYSSRGMIQSVRGNKEAAKTDMQKSADIYLERGETENRQNVLNLMEQFDL